MSFLEELAELKCERFTSRDGCAKETEQLKFWCSPCRARRELGLPAEAPRRCDECGHRLDVAIGTTLSHDLAVFDMDASPTCPPKPHRPVLFYDEYARVAR